MDERKTVIGFKIMKKKRENKSGKVKIAVPQIFKRLRPIQEKKDRIQQILDILNENALQFETFD